LVCYLPNILDALSSWFKAYQTYSRSNTHPSSFYFHASSIIIHQFSTVLLNIPLSVLQNAIGKEGTTGSTQAFLTLTRWARKSPEVADEAAYHAIKTIMMLAASKDEAEGGIKNIDTAPYSLITIFLCHIVLWVFANVAPHSQKLQLFDTVSRTIDMKYTTFSAILRRAFRLEQIGISPTKARDTIGNGSDVASIILLKSAAGMLTRLGTWGASLNLALLLHERAEM
jgi:hypothetical protein